MKPAASGTLTVTGHHHEAESTSSNGDADTFYLLFMRYAGCQSVDQFLLSYKSVLLLVVLNVVLFHAAKLTLLVALIAFFCVG